jgi:hypothetical protein
MQKIRFYLFLTLFFYAFVSCTKEEIKDFLNFGFGLLKEDYGQIPMSSNFGYGNSNLPSSYDMSDRLPPIGNQGNVGTCVGWACGYYARTAMEAVKRNWYTNNLNASRTFSPKDLYLSIDDNLKGGNGDNCKGTQFTHAMKMLNQRGIATWQTVPHNLENYQCSKQNLQSSWTNEASQYKISSYRRVSPTIDAIKQRIAKNIPVIFGATVGDPFGRYRGGILHNINQVRGDKEGGHAMVVVGYDDNKNAFKIVNSWGSGWGENGFGWVDYNLFISNSFLSRDGSGYAPVFEMQINGTNVPPNEDTENPTTQGGDLASYVFEDRSINGNQRRCVFNIYNIGSNAQQPTNWDFGYIYVNAYDVNDYGVIFYNRFNTSIATNTYNCSGNSCTINVSIPSNGSLSQTMFNSQQMYQNYVMPNLNGYYLILALADVTGVINESNEQNNVFYVTPNPVSFVNGYGKAQGQKSTEKEGFSFKNVEQFSSDKLQKSPFHSAINAENWNAYSNGEIKQFIKQELIKGNLEKKIKAYQNKMQNNTILQGN